ncbi:MATE family efflux transporter [Bacteroidota bacterium]
MKENIWKGIFHIKYRTLIRSISSEISASLNNEERDYTKENVKRAIFLLSVPMILEMVMESIFAVVDIYFVSKIGSEAVATVGLTESMMSIVYSISFGLAIAASAVISRRIGEKKPEEAANAAVQAIFAALMVSVVIAVPGVLFASDMLSLMGASQEISEKLYGYATIMFGTNIVINFLFIINGIFRSAGDAALSMRALWLANILNIILDPCLIFGLWIFPEMGIEGAAVATSIGRGTAVIYQFYLLFKGKGRIKISLANVKIDFKVIFQIFKLSTGSIGQNIIAMSSWIALVAILASFGSISVAGYTIAIRIIIFSLLPSWGMSNAASTLVGQNLGANQPDRAEQSVWLTSKYNLILLGFIGVLYVIFAEFWVGLFIAEPDVILKGAECLRIVSYGFLAYGVGMIVMHSFNGSGDTLTPTWINIGCFWFLEIPLAYMMAIVLGADESGVYYSIVISEIVLTIVSVILFKRGKWKERKV